MSSFISRNLTEIEAVAGFDWMIEIYLQTEGQGTHHKMVSLQPMPGFPPLFNVACFHGQHFLCSVFEIPLVLLAFAITFKGIITLRG